QGGSIGWITRQSPLVPEFKSAAFSLNKGQLSGLVQSTYGFHILRVDDKHEPGLQPFEEARKAIEPLAKQDKASKRAEALANSVEVDARAQGLDAAAAKHHL